MFLVKLSRTGFETVLGRYFTLWEALVEARRLNTQYQTDEYYVEGFDSQRVGE
jgi:hypothetical protein